MADRNYSRTPGVMDMISKIFLIACCLAAGSSSAKDNIDSLIFSIAESQKHKLISTKKIQIHPIEDSLYQTKSWTSFSFKSKVPLRNTGEEKYYFKYTVGVLTFEDSLLAARRVDSVNAYFLREDKVFKKTQYGLRVGNQVIFLTTHPMIYKSSLKTLFQTYQARVDR
jgi:hypothetical protein